MSLSENEAKYIVDKMLPTIRKGIETSTLPTKRAGILMSTMQDIFPTIEREGINHDVYCKIAEASLRQGLAVDIGEDKKSNVLIEFRVADEWDIKLSQENCEARWYMLKSKLFDGDEINSLTNEGAKDLLEKGPMIFRIDSEKLKGRGFVPFKEYLTERGVLPITRDNIVYTISKDQKYIEDIKKLLYQNRSDFPFGDTSLKYIPNTKPGFRGYYILLVSNPSPELIRAIIPSSEGELIYPQLSKFGSEELANIIRDKFYNQRKTITEIAKELDVEEHDIRTWIFYYM